MIFLRGLTVGLAFLMTLGVCGSEAGEQPLSEKRLIVGTKEAPPFSMKTKEGTWTGIGIDLWRDIASGLNLGFEFRELDLKTLLEGISNGSLDVAVAALTITSERETAFDFTHPFYTTGLGIAVPSRTKSPWLTVLKGFLSRAFLKVVVVLALLLLVVGILVWWFERRKNVKQFGGDAVKGIGSGFWWSAVTMTTVGYGDKAPVSLGGRIVALVWMFAAIIIISGFTAAITSSLTVTQLESPVSGPEDLPKVRVGTIEETTSAAYLRENQISFQPYKKPLEGLIAIADGEIEAFVYDTPLLRYLVNLQFRGKLEVLPKTFERQDYGIALPANSPLREPINRALLKKIREPAWQETLSRYLGR
ncbi:MAG: transporter substrate-binding domain-containing protein [Desulfobacteraceae bacterium]|nr:transporter substrate-binding domain-containing protein [Desulfobacteraceae bacterium]